MFFLISNYAFSIEQEDFNLCEKRIETFATAIELWTIEHDGNYPGEGDLSSKEFFKYLKEASVGKDEKSPELYLICPETKELYEYKIENGECIIKCPNPRVHGWNNIVYISSKGLIRVPLELSLTEKDKLSDKDRKEILKILSDLYVDYKNKDLDEIFSKLSLAIYNSAVLNSQRNYRKPYEYIEAEKQTTSEVVNHKDFVMKPLKLDGIDIIRAGNIYQVTGITPCIESKYVKVVDPYSDKTLDVKIRISKFIMYKGNNGWKILLKEY